MEGRDGNLYVCGKDGLWTLGALIDNAGSGNANTPPVLPDELYKKCQMDAGNLGATFVLDASFFTSIYKGIVYALGARSAASQAVRLGEQEMWNYGGRGAYLYALGAGAAARTELADAARSLVKTVPVTAALEHETGSGFNWRDFVPGFATKHAYDSMKSSCIDIDK